MYLYDYSGGFLLFSFGQLSWRGWDRIMEVNARDLMLSALVLDGMVV